MPSIQSRLMLQMSKVMMASLFDDFDYERVRKRFSRFDRYVPAPRGVRIEPVQLPACTAEWIRSPDCTSDRVVMHLPGGAWVLSSPHLHRRMVASMVKTANAHGFLVSYRLAPEHPFPAALDDCIDAYQYLLASGVRPERIVIGGDSAGGNLCLAMLQVLRDRGQPQPAGAYALSPVTDLRSVDITPGGSSRDPDAVFQIKDHGARDPRRLYVGGNDELFSHPYVSPICGDLRGLCPLLLQSGSTETLRHDAVKFVDKARACGVDAEAEVWQGQAHVWQASVSLPESELALEHLGDFIRRCCP